MGVSALIKNMMTRILEKDSYHLPGLLAAQLSRQLEKNALERLGLHLSLTPREFRTTRLKDGRTQAHVNLDVNLSKADLARIMEQAIFEKTGMKVTVQPRSLIVHERVPGTVSVHLNSDVQFDKDDILSRL